MTGKTLEEVRERYVAERPNYQRLAETTASMVRDELLRRGVRCRVESRAKTVDRLITKIIRKAYPDLDGSVKDKAGVRVVVAYTDQLRIAEEAVRGTVYVVQEEDKRKNVDTDVLDYVGTHFEVRLNDAASVIGDDWFNGKLVEIQVLTAAESLWADVSHPLLYKPVVELSREAQRAVRRLVALMEIFDGEVARARDELRASGALEQAEILAVVEPLYYRFTTRLGDPKLSLHLIGGLMSSLGPGVIRDSVNRLDAFVDANTEKFQETYAAYRADQRATPLLHQPEALLVFELLEHDRFAVDDAWPDVLPIEHLDELKAVWGR